MNNLKTPEKSGPKIPKKMGQASRPEAINRSAELPSQIIRFKRPKSIKNTFLNLQSRLSQTPRVRQLLAFLGLLFLVITIPLTVILVRQRVEYIPRAYPGQPCSVDSNCSGYPNERCVGGVCETIPPTSTPTPRPPTPTPTPEPGFCGTCSPSKSPGWIPGAPGPVDCNGTKCNDGSRNYCCWDDNNDNICDMCATGQTPDVECSGTCITFRGMQGQSVKFCEHYASNDVSCPYGISNPNCYTVNIPSNPYTKCIPSNKCGQLEANNYCGVCKPTGCMVAPTSTPTPKPTATPTPRPTSTPTPKPTPTPTPTPPTLCLDLTSTAEGPFLQQGQVVTFTCIGSSGIDNPIDHVDFQVQINSGTWIAIGTVGVTLMPDGTYQGSITYTVLTTGVYRFECRVCTTSYCTVWGKAQ